MKSILFQIFYLKLTILVRLMNVHGIENCVPLLLVTNLINEYNDRIHNVLHGT